MARITASMLDGIMSATQDIVYFDGANNECWRGVGLMPSWLQDAEICMLEFCEDGAAQAFAAIIYNSETGEWETY